LNNIVTTQSKEDFGWTLAPLVNFNAAKHCLALDLAG